MIKILYRMTRPRDFPEQLPLFQEAVRTARASQTNCISQDQYEALEREYLLECQPFTSPLFGWYYSNRARLRMKLQQQGVGIEKAPIQGLHTFVLTESGFKRLRELEQKFSSELL